VSTAVTVKIDLLVLFRWFNQPDLGLASVAAIMAISTPTYTNTRVMFRRQRPNLAIKIPLAVGGEEKERKIAGQGKSVL